jgi:hypothetical protein
MAASDSWKTQHGHYVCTLLASGMTLHAAAALTAAGSNRLLDVTTATTLARAAVPNYCPAHLGDLALDGTAPLDRTLDDDGQAACFYLDFARFLNAGGHVDGDITLAEAVYVATVMAKNSSTVAFQTAWFALQSDISTPVGLADRRALCEQNGWSGRFGGLGSPTPSATVAVPSGTPV